MLDFEANVNEKSNVENEDWEPLTQKEYEKYKKAGITIEETLIKEMKRDVKKK